MIFITNSSEDLAQNKNATLDYPIKTKKKKKKKDLSLNPFDADFLQHFGHLIEFEIDF